MFLQAIPGGERGQKEGWSQVVDWLGQGGQCILRTTLLFLSPKDLYTAPDSCEGRCEEPYSEEDECHCNTECERYHNCCEDYYRHCQPGEHPWVTEGGSGGLLSP